MKFRYQARDKQGKTQIGVIGASSKEAALRLLEGYGLFITLLEAEHEQLLLARDIEWFNRVGLKDVLIFSRELAIMFKARVPLLEALAVLAHQMKNKSFKERASDIAEAVEGGTSLSAALAKHPGIFSSFFVSMVRSGEASGKLAEALEYLADHLEREHEVNRKVVAAMVYPAFVVGVTLIILLMIAYVVVPNFLSVLAANNQQMPLITKVVVAFAMGLRQWGLLIALALAAAAIGLARYCKTKEGKALWDAFLLRIPLLGSLLRMVYVARFAENLSTLITGGLPITRALDIVNDVVENTVYRRIIAQAKEEVSKGNKIYTVLARYPNEFPAVFTEMVQVGEGSGTLDVALLDVVRFYQKELMSSIDGFLNILEPALIVVLGLMVGGIMAALIIPLYQISGSM